MVLVREIGRGKTMLIKMDCANAGGGELKPTTLWSHTATSGETFTAQSASLSDDIDNYAFIGIKYAFDSSHLTDTNCIGTVLMSVTDFKKSIDSTSNVIIINHII